MNLTGIFVDNLANSQTRKYYYLAAPVDLTDAVKACQSDDWLIGFDLNFDLDVTQGGWATNITTSRNDLDALP